MEDYKKITINSYSKNAKDFSEKFKSLLDTKERKEFKKFISLLKGKEILDLGCGSGDHSKYFSDNGLNVTPIDLSEEMVRICKEKGVDAQIMDIEDLKFKENSFDGIWAVTSLLHVPKSKIEAVIKKLHSILKKDGILYVCVKEGHGEGFIEDKNSDTKRYFVFWGEEIKDVFSSYFKTIEFQKIESKGRVFLELFLEKISL